ncbi:MAG: bifunctional precorrin-2 dehydrogenase/sirohydrochlorin ferrochelatase [Bacteroidetes bacterium]|nr:MAG: bifunctional precorrin-2 dehydrogenase/sirohydrochlorin ferrochelatase [Bacteroidota bacterium]
MISNDNIHGNQLYPIFLKLEQLELLLVGAGNVGLEKLNSLLANSPEARITVVAPFVKDEVKDLLQNHPSCILFQRQFEEADLENKSLIILATDDKELHTRIKKLAEHRRIIVNVADTPALCDFYLGSIVQKGNLKIAISTNGKSPTTAKRIKELLESTMPDEIDELLINLNLIRNKMTGDFTDKVRQLNELTKMLTEKE